MKKLLICSSVYGVLMLCLRGVWTLSMGRQFVSFVPAGDLIVYFFSEHVGQKWLWFAYGFISFVPLFFLWRHVRSGRSGYLYCAGLAAAFGFFGHLAGYAFFCFAQALTAHDNTPGAIVRLGAVSFVVVALLSREIALSAGKMRDALRFSSPYGSLTRPNSFIDECSVVFIAFLGIVVLLMSGW